MTSIEESVEAFLRNTKAKRRSPRTVQHYSWSCRKLLLPFCSREGITEVSQLNQEYLDRIAIELQERDGARGPLSPHSIKTYLKGVNQYLAWARKHDGAGAAKAELPTTPRRVIDTLTRAEVQQLEDAVDAERDKLIVRLMADTGARLDEVTSLRVSDVYERDRTTFVRVVGKGDKQREIHVFPRVYQRLRRYADRGRPKDARSDRLFMSRRRRPGGDYEPLTKSGVYLVIKGAAERAGLTKRVHPHLLRHSAITWMLSRGLSPVMVANVAGHGSLDMIYRVYSHVTPVNIADEMRRLRLDDEDAE